MKPSGTDSIEDFSVLTPILPVPIPHLTESFFTFFYGQFSSIEIHSTKRSFRPHLTSLDWALLSSDVVSIQIHFGKCSFYSHQEGQSYQSQERFTPIEIATTDDYSEIRTFIHIVKFYYKTSPTLHTEGWFWLRNYRWFYHADAWWEDPNSTFDGCIVICNYRLDPVNLNTFSSQFHLIQTFTKISAFFLSFQC